MASKLFDRVATLLKADAHGVIESLEERSLLLKQCVREAEIELNRKRARLEVVRDEAKRLREALTGAEVEMRSLDEDVTLALSGGKEELARFATRRLLERRRATDTLRAQLTERAEEERTLGERVEVQQAQFESLRTRVRAELARRSETSDPAAWACAPGVADEEVELELLRRRHAEEGGR
ncbi:MAG: PspA/IM30 family protein [Gaiellaceae bacterium]